LRAERRRWWIGRPFEIHRLSLRRNAAKGTV
jgi:hypothetical protein